MLLGFRIKFASLRQHMPTLKRLLDMVRITHRSQIRFASLSSSSSAEGHNNILILGGGIAGLSTARYLLRYARHHRNNNTTVTLIDKNIDVLEEINYDSSRCPLSYEERISSGRPHKNIPSRRNGNYLCPSLIVPWTARPLWSEVILPLLKFGLGSGRGKNHRRPPITFDWPSLLADRNMWSFGIHFLLQKFILGHPEHNTNKSILEYSMKCMNDPSDELVQSIKYGRFAIGTKSNDGTVANDCDSTGDIDLFCRGLLEKLLAEYKDDGRFSVISGEEVVKLQLDNGILRGVSTIDQDGNRRKRNADMIVVAMGTNSISLCQDIGVPCPVYPVKGHLVTVASKFDHQYNLTLDGGIGFAAPLVDLDSQGRRLYRLSGFVDFTSTKTADSDRIDALLDATRSQLPDLEMIDASACHRPISADDRALIGPVGAEYPNLYLITGLGSRGWTIGLGSGKLLASQMLNLPCDIDPTPYLPTRFNLLSRK